MLKFLLCSVFLLVFYNIGFTQTFILSGKISNNSLEPLAFATIKVKETPLSTQAKENGTFLLELEKGQYDIIVSLVGYKVQEFKVVLLKNEVLNVVLEENRKASEEAVVIGQRKDRSEEIIRKVIANKDVTTKAVKGYSVDVYIKATEIIDRKKTIKTNKKQQTDSVKKTPSEFLNLSMSEIKMKVDVQTPNKIKEFREGVQRRGNPEGLFYKSTTEGDFSLYNNLINARGLSPSPFLSPISYSGLIAYKYKTVNIQKDKATGRTYYTISFKPTTLSNTTLTGQVVIMDSSWVITESKFSFPNFHLPEYDFFEASQTYELINDSAWLITKQDFTYYSKQGKDKYNGNTKVFYNNFLLNPIFPTKHFGVEKSITTAEAYKRDSSYWYTVRTEPLTDKELRFVRYKDSVYFATTSKAYLDSIDKITNKITYKKLLLDGITFYNRAKERKIEIGSLLSMYEPLGYGGERYGYNASYNKTFASKKDVGLFGYFSVGRLNKDVNGQFTFNRMYNPFNRGFYRFELGRDFDQLFEGDIFYNTIQKRNVFRKYNFNVAHGLEIANGLFLNNRIEIARRESLVGLKFANAVANIPFFNFLDSSINRPRDFPTHNVFYNVVSLSYTPFQEYMREPLQKVILGSKWPTFGISWRKGIPGIIGSGVNYDLVEATVRQTLKLGTVGISKYTVKIGNFLNRDSLNLPDKKFMRGADQYLFFAPEFNFQHLDSTFEITKSYIEGHYIHEFNGAILNKIPLIKKLRFRELAGGGFLIVPERNLRYIEAFVGIETKTFNIFRERMKFGVFVVGSVANQFRNPIQIKFAIRQWDRNRNRWN